jgi:hypothetical protein
MRHKCAIFAVKEEPWLQLRALRVAPEISPLGSKSADSWSCGRALQAQDIFSRIVPHLAIAPSTASYQNIPCCTTHALGHAPLDRP